MDIWSLIKSKTAVAEIFSVQCCPEYFRNQKSGTTVSTVSLGSLEPSTETQYVPNSIERMIPSLFLRHICRGSYACLPCRRGTWEYPSLRFLPRHACSQCLSCNDAASAIHPRDRCWLLDHKPCDGTGIAQNLRRAPASRLDHDLGRF